MIKNIDNKIEVLEENFREYCRNSEDGQGDGMSIREYVKRESENDPNFFSWVYDEIEGNEIPEQEVIDNDMDNLLAIL